MSEMCNASIIRVMNKMCMKEQLVEYKHTRPGLNLPRPMDERQRNKVRREREQGSQWERRSDHSLTRGQEAEYGTRQENTICGMRIGRNKEGNEIEGKKELWNK
jgi:hypothetical protein